MRLPVEDPDIEQAVIALALFEAAGLDKMAEAGRQIAIYRVQYDQRGLNIVLTIPISDGPDEVFDGEGTVRPDRVTGGVFSGEVRQVDPVAAVSVTKRRLFWKYLGVGITENTSPPVAACCAPDRPESPARA